MFYGVLAPAVYIFSIKCLVLYRAGQIYSMKSLVLYRAGSQMLCFTVFSLLGPLKCYVLQCSGSRGANFLDKMLGLLSRRADILDEKPAAAAAAVRMCVSGSRLSMCMLLAQGICEVSVDPAPCVIHIAICR